MSRTTLRTLAALALALAAGVPARAGSSGFGPPGGEPPFTVDLSAPEGRLRRNETFEVAVLFRVREGNYLYREKVEVALAEGGDLALAGVELPAAEVKRTIGPDGEEGDIAVYKHDAVVRARLRVPRDFARAKAAAALLVRFQGCAEAGICHPPEEKTLPIEVSVDLAAPAVEAAAAPASGAEEGGVPAGFWSAVLWALLVGLGVSFTPCMYPLIPITAAVVTSQARGKGWAAHLRASLLFVLGLSIVYALLGLVAGNMGVALQSRAATAVLGVLFFLLAASLFGAYDLKLPDPVARRLRARARVTGPGSLLVFGAVSGLIVGPCVSGPLGALLFSIGRGGTGSLTGFFALFAFAWGMSVLLVAVGTFPGLLARLPKAGGWMGAVKAALGVAILAAGLYFAKNLVPLAAFTPAALAVSAVLGAALLAWAFVRRMATRLGHLRETAAAALLLLAAYLGAGIAHANGAAVPRAYAFLPSALLAAAAEARAGEEPGVRVEWVPGEAAALERAREERKPLLVDFYADWCITCLGLERRLFGDEAIVRELRERFVALRVDGSRRSAENLRLQEKYGGQYPTIVLLDSSGREAARFAGDVEPGAFLEKLRAVR